MVFNSGLLRSEIKGNWGVLEDPMSPGSMYSHSIYLKLNNAIAPIAVQDFRYFQAQVYTIRVHSYTGKRPILQREVKATPQR